MDIKQQSVKVDQETYAELVRRKVESGVPIVIQIRKLVLGNPAESTPETINTKGSNP